jgi:hypothetical protein
VLDSLTPSPPHSLAFISFTLHFSFSLRLSVFLVLPSLPLSFTSSSLSYLLQHLLDPPRLFGIEESRVQQHASSSLAHSLLEPVKEGAFLDAVLLELRVRGGNEGGSNGQKDG